MNCRQKWWIAIAIAGLAFVAGTLCRALAAADINTLAVKGISSFAGAFFAFLFYVVGRVCASIHRRQSDHFRALQRLELLLNDQVNLLFKNSLVAISIHKESQEIAKSEARRIIFDRLFTVPVDKSLIVGLANQNLASDIYGFFTKLESHNIDVRGVGAQYDCFVSAYLTNHIEKRDYLANVLIFGNSMAELGKFVQGLRDDATTYLAQVRLRLQRDTPLLHRLVPHLVAKTHEEGFAADVVRERDVLKAEFANVMHRDMNEIKQREQ